MMTKIMPAMVKPRKASREARRVAGGAALDWSVSISGSPLIARKKHEERRSTSEKTLNPRRRRKEALTQSEIRNRKSESPYVVSYTHVDSVKRLAGFIGKA